MTLALFAVSDGESIRGVVRVENDVVTEYELDGALQPLLPLSTMTGGMRADGAIVEGIQMVQPSDPNYLVALYETLGLDGLEMSFLAKSDA